MRVVVSALSVQPGRIGGAEFMIRNLINGLAELKDVALTIVAPRGVEGWPASATVTHPGTNANRFVSEATLVPLLARRLGADALLLPNYFTPPISPGVRTATVIHDTLFRTIPEVFSAGKRAWLRACHGVTMSRATTVVAISDTVARELRHIYGDDGRVVTIPVPVDWDRFGGDTAPAPLGGRPYILSVAAEWPHKNMATLVNAYRAVSRRVGGCALVLVGQTRAFLRGHNTRMTPSVASLVSGAALRNDIVQTGHVTDAELGSLYRHARGFVFPSLFEGFGMPPVEALGMGLPVVTTRCGAIPEATRDLGHYVDNPLDDAELGRALVALSQEPQRFAPSPRDVQALREYYSPSRIAALYRDEALN